MYVPLINSGWGQVIPDLVTHTLVGNISSVSFSLGEWYWAIKEMTTLMKQGRDH